MLMADLEIEPLWIGRRLWRTITDELAARGDGDRESGAFLLGRRRERRAYDDRRVVAAAYYDDLDPDCLTGAITFSGSGYSRLWDLCDENGCTVLADAHTHPGSSTHQSRIDSANPMISKPGHIGVILPHLATDDPAPRNTGVHVYLGAGDWESRFGQDAADLLRVRTDWALDTEQALRRILRTQVPNVHDASRTTRRSG